MDRLSPLLSQSHHIGHTYCTCVDRSVCTYTLDDKGRQNTLTQSHLETGHSGQWFQTFLRNLGRQPKKIISRTRWILIRVFKNRTKMLKPRLKLVYSHWWKCTICILANIWHIFIDEHNICSDCQSPVADAEDQAQLCKHFGHFKYLVFYLSAYTTRKSQNHSAVSTSPKNQQES